ncbi:hypothetical protein D9V86_09035, partial [Bacteroidetes/Chlorobi group bacterium ChocPot_Mid]
GAGRIITVNSGAVDMQGSNAADYTLKLSNSANGGVLNLDNNGTGNGIYLESGASNYPFVVSSTGKVGIGSTNPNAQLEISPTGNDAIIINPNASSSPTYLKFLDAAGGDFVGFVAPNVITTSVVWTLPTSDGTAGQVLATNGSGALSWSSAGIPAGNDGSVQYNNGGVLGGEDNFFWDDINKRLGLRTNTPDATLNIVGGTGVNALHIRSGQNDGVDYIMHLEDTDGSVQAMYVDVSGNVGLGTTTPADRLHVNGAVLREGWFMGYRATNLGLASNGDNTVPWTAEQRKDNTYYTHNANSADITITSSGWYRISYCLNIQNTDAGGNRNTMRGWVTNSGTEIPGSMFWVYSDDNNVNRNYNSGANSFIANLSAGSVINVHIQSTRGGAGATYNVLTNSQITIERIDE